MGKVRINQGRTVPLTFRFLGAVVVFGSIIAITKNLPENFALPLSIFASFLLPMLWFSYDILTIDTTTKIIHQGVWVMGYKTGKPRSFNKIEKIYVNQVNTSQKMYSRANLGYDIKGVEYHAYIILDDGEKYFITSDNSEKRLDQRMTKIRKKLGLT